jgi:hypothetical protein
MTPEEREQIRADREAQKEEARKTRTEGVGALGPSPSDNANQSPPKEEEMISVKKSVLDQILDNQNKLTEQNKMLMFAADKSRIAKYNDSLGATITRVVRLRVYQGQLVVGWGRLLEDTMEKDGNGRWHEKQVIPVYTEDGKEWPMLYPDFAKMPKIEAEIIEKSEKVLSDDERDLFGGDNAKKFYYTLKVSSKGPLFGKEIKLAENFINS